MITALQKKHIAELDFEFALKRYGYNTLSAFSLYPGIKYFSVPEIDGFIPYIQSNNLILSAGEPVCHKEDIPKLVKKFVKQFYTGKNYIGFIPVSERGSTYFKNLDFSIISIGKEPIFDLKNLKKPDRKIRNNISRAIKKGLKVIPYNSSYEMDINRCCREWKKSREMPAMKFLFELNPLKLKEQKRYFLLINNEKKLKAFLSCSPIYERNGWHLNDLIREEDAPHGCNELLVTEALKTLSEEGFAMASYGLAPLSKLPNFDFSHPFVNKVLRFIYEKLSFIYHFQSLEYFKDKFEPDHWEDNKICFYPNKVSLGLVNDILNAFVPGGLPSIISHKLKKLLLQK